MAGERLPVPQRPYAQRGQVVPADDRERTGSPARLPVLRAGGTAGGGCAMMEFGYARTSTDDQANSIDAQRAALTAAGCERIFADPGQSGRKASRPEFDRMLGQLRACDRVTVTRLDRLSRSVRDLMALSERFRAEDVDLRILDTGVDTSTAMGKLFYTILA